jgi:rhodanese-related sulfurtransferase
MESTPVARRGYARPELLTETDWLAAHLDDRRVRIVDARGPQQYAAAHIPGAVNLDGFGAGIPRAANATWRSPSSSAVSRANLASITI